jgi:dephospho-CoA kinase
VSLPALRIGLTGGIGSGKSTVATMLARLGAHVVDADVIARGLTVAGGVAMPQIAARFGHDMLAEDGALDRARMRERAFADPSALRALESILHPLIGREAQAEASRAAAGQPVVFDVPLLAESPHWRDRVQRILVVDCPEEEQVRRVMARSGWREEDVRRAITQQAPRAQRRAIADAVILNHGLSLDELEAKVRQVWLNWTAKPAI